MNTFKFWGKNENNKESWLSAYSWFIILTGILLIAGICLFTRYQIKYDYDRTIEESSQVTMNLTNAYEEYVRRIITDADKDLVNLKVAYEREGIVSPFFVAFENYVGKDVSRNRVALLNEQGIVISSPAKDAIGVNSADREFFLVHRDVDSNKIEIGKPIFSRVDGSATIPLTRRINKADGSFAGIVYIGLKESFFLSYYNKVNLGRDQRISLTGGDGFIRARQSGNNSETGQDIRSSEFWRITQSGPSDGTYISLNPLDNITRLGAYRIMPDYPLIVSVGKSMEVTLTDYQQRKKGYILGTVLASVFIFVVCILLINRNEKTRRLMMAVQMEKDRLAVLINSISDEVWLFDANQQLTLVNPAVIQEFGINPVANFEVLRVDGTPRPLKEAPSLRALQGEFVQGEVELVQPPGTEEWRIREVSASPVRDDDDNIIGAISIVRDITKRKRMEEKLQEINATLEGEINERKSTEKSLQETQAILQAALDNCQAGIAVADAPDGRLRYLNKAGQLIINDSNGDSHVGASDYLINWNISHENGVPFEKHEVPLARAICYGETYSDEFVIPREHNNDLTIWANAAPIKDEEGNIKAGIIIFLDISERKRIEKNLIKAKEEAERANIAKSKFLANMSHEIRTPMNGIIGMTDITLMTNLEEKQREYLNIVKSSTMSLLRVLNDILDYSKIEAGKVELEETNFDIWETTTEVIDLFNISAKQKGLSIKLNINNEIPHTIIGDSVRLRQVLSNLVGNGIKFTSQGEIVIDINVEERYADKLKLRFVVADTGIGIPDEKLDKLFKRFSQIDDSHAKQFGGTGLGLAISKKLIEIMNGEIRVESKEGVGSRFFFTAVFGISDELQITEQESTPNKVDKG